MDFRIFLHQNKLVSHSVFPNISEVPSYCSLGSDDSSTRQARQKSSFHLPQNAKEETSRSDKPEGPC